MSEGIPCERTFKNLFNSIKPEAMEQALRDIAALIREKIPGEVICFDGQTERRTAEKHLNLSGIHLLNAWSADNRICIGQLKVDDKSNEITAMPELMESLDLKNTMITADALNTQKKTATKAIDCGADYLLPVKGNQGILLDEITSAFNQLDIDTAKAEKHWKRAISKANRVGARNLAVVRKIALNAVSKETSMKGGIATKQYAASFNPAYRDKILKNLF